MMAKHDETYMQREFKEPMAEGHVDKLIPAAAVLLTAPR